MGDLLDISSLQIIWFAAGMLGFIAELHVVPISQILKSCDLQYHMNGLIHVYVCASSIIDASHVLET